MDKAVESAMVPLLHSFLSLPVYSRLYRLILRRGSKRPSLSFKIPSMSYPFAVVDRVANGSFNGLFRPSKDLLLGLLNVFLSHDLESCL